MSTNTAAEARMLKLIAIRNHSDTLCRLFDKEIAPSLASYYGVLHLVKFLDAYEGLLCKLSPEQKEKVLCFTGLISDVYKHRDALRRVRNGWIAHIPDDDFFDEGASGFVRRVRMPGDPATHYEMLACTVKFIDILRALLPDIARPAVEKFNLTADADPKFHCVDLGQVDRNISAKLDSALKNAEEKLPGMPWDSLLAAVGASLDQLGPADTSAGAAGGGGDRR